MHKPAWLEGTLLTQQLFQQWEQYFEHKFLFLMQKIMPFYWGIISLKIDESALLASKYRILECLAIMPNGEFIYFDYTIHGELCLDLKSAQQHEIFLAYPVNESIQGITGYQNEPYKYGYRAHFENVKDCYDEKRCREVTYKIPNLVLLDQTAETDEYFRLKIAEIHCADYDQFSISDTFIPSMPVINNAKFFIQFIREIKNLVLSKAAYFSEDSSKKHNQLIWQLYLTKNRLELFNKNLSQQPIKLYEILNELLEMICLESNLKEENTIVKYDHYHLKDTFENLKLKIINVLEKVSPSKRFFLTLNHYANSILISSKIEDYMFNRCQFYLIIKNEKFDTQKIKEFLLQIKIASPSEIQILINSALSSMNLQKETETIFENQKAIEFLIVPDNHYWRAIKKENQMCIFIPDKFQHFQYELVAIEVGERNFDVKKISFLSESENLSNQKVT